MDNEKAKYEALNLLIAARKKSRLSQQNVADYFAVSSRSIIAWEGGTSTPEEGKIYIDKATGKKTTRREHMIACLWDKFNLKTDEQQFHQIWRELVVGVWGWADLTEDEKKNLVPLPLTPLKLHHYVPSRPLNIRRVVGRERLLANLKERLLIDNRIALTGKPGVGKTILAVELAHDREMMERFPDGILWVRMGRDPTVMNELRAIAEALGIIIQPGEPINKLELSKKIKNIIKRRHLLIVIDDVWDPWQEVADYFTFDAPNCRTILTTRDEVIAKMLAGASRMVSIPELEYESDDNPAYVLLHDLAPEACAVNPDTAQHLVTLVGGLPLALVVLGGYLSESEHSYFSDIQEKALTNMKDPNKRLQAVAKRLGDVDNREMTLQALIELSVENLSKPAKDAFYALGAFASKPEHFARHAAEVVTKTDPLTLNLLIARNLLERDIDEQLALHQVIADVARTKTSVEAIKCHRTFYLAVVIEEPNDLHRIEQVYGQIKWAQNTTLDTETLFEFDPVFIYQHSRGLWDDASSRIERLIPRAEAKGDQATVAKLCVNLGNTYLAQGKLVAAAQQLEESCRLFRCLGNNQDLAISLLNLGQVYLEQKKFDETIACYKESCRLFRDGEDHFHEGRVLHNLGTIYTILGKKEVAIAYFQECLNIQRQLDDSRGIAGLLSNLGALYLGQGKLKEANEKLEESIRIWQELGDYSGESASRVHLSLYYVEQKKWVETAQQLEESLRLKQESLVITGTETILYNLSNVYVKLEKWEEAAQLYRESLFISQQEGNILIEGLTLNALASVFQKLNKPYDAINYYEIALSIFKQLDEQQYVIIALQNLATIHIEQRDFESGIRYYEELLAVYLELGNIYSYVRDSLRLRILKLSQFLASIPERTEKQDPELPKIMGEFMTKTLLFFIFNIVLLLALLRIIPAGIGRVILILLFLLLLVEL